MIKWIKSFFQKKKITKLVPITIAVLYQDEQALKDFVTARAEEALFSSLNKYSLKVTLKAHIQYQEIHYHFCKMYKQPSNDLNGVMKIAGLQIQGFWCCDGEYNEDTLNYLASRIRFPNER